MADIPTFRIAFPEFSAISATDAQLTYWFAQAPFAQNVVATPPGCPPGFQGSALGQNLDLAVMLFAAHNITLGAINAAAAARPGAAVGVAASGPISGKGAGGLSVTYDTGAVAITGAGIYNATSYGQRLWKMLEIAAMGGTYAPRQRQRGFGFGLRR